MSTLSINFDREAENDVLACFVHNGNVATHFMNSLFASLNEDARRAGEEGARRRLVEYHDARGPYIHDNRARAVRYFLDYTNYQWLWMLDNDMKWEKDTLYKLIDAAEKYDCGILGAAYWNKYGNSEIKLSWLYFVEEHGIAAAPTLPEQEEPVEVTAVGMGCTLIHRQVLEDVVAQQRKIAPEDPWDSFGADLLKFTTGEAEHMGEDVTFCLRARRAGYLTYGLPTVTAEHFKPIFMPHGSADAPGIVPVQGSGYEVTMVPSERKTADATV